MTDAARHRPPADTVVSGLIGAAAIEVEILRQTAVRGPDRSICPSEVARAPDNSERRRLMAPVRRAAVVLAPRGRIATVRKGKAIRPEAMRCVICLRAPRPEGLEGARP